MKSLNFNYVIGKLTFIRFVGLNPEDTTPDANTLWDFRALLTKQNQLSNLFNRFNQYLDSKGLCARKGQMVGASFVKASRQRNTREQNQTIKDGLVPAEFLENPHAASQKDRDAHWLKKMTKIILVTKTKSVSML